MIRRLPQAPQRTQRRTRKQLSHVRKSFLCTVVNITNDKAGLRAENVALGLGRIPAGFYVVVQHSGLEWRTENKHSLVNNNVVEWGGPIPL